MTKKITLETLATQLARMDGNIGKLDARMERGFAAADSKFGALADDIVDLRTDLKGDIVRVAEQVNSIETQLRGVQHVKLQSRVADLEEEVFGKPRG